MSSNNFTLLYLFYSVKRRGHIEKSLRQMCLLEKLRSKKHEIWVYPYYIKNKFKKKALNLIFTLIEFIFEF